MALLTAEDVLNKAFSKTKYREGFDQDEVDDFLDEVANTIAQLTSERDELAARIAGGAGAPVVPAATEAPPVTSAGGVPGTTGLLAAATEPGAVNPTGMLAMAQKLHDEYVQAGEAERDRIIDEAHGTADQIRERADEDAKARMDELAGERVELEGRIDDLRRFERDYRARLKQYLENLLGDLDHSGVAGAGAAGLAAGAAAFVATDEPSAPAADAPVADAPASEAPEADAPVADAPEADAYGADAEQEPAGEQHAFGGLQPAGDAPNTAWDAPQADAVAETVPGEHGDVADDGEAAKPVSFEDAISGLAPAPQSTWEAPAAETPSWGQQPEAPSYDATQPWENQLRPPSDGGFTNPFAPVTPPTSEPAATEASGDVPSVEAAEEAEEAPYTPPSTRMFSDLYGQQRPESEK
jgi:DivIVA domain-containing protein